MTCPTWTIQVRRGREVWQWSGVTLEELGRVAGAIGATPDGVDEVGVFVDFRNEQPWRHLPTLSPEAVRDALRRPAIMWLE